MGATDVLRGFSASVKDVQADHPELEERSQQDAADVAQAVVGEVADAAQQSIRSGEACGCQVTGEQVVSLS